MASATYSAEHVDQLLRCPVCLDRYNSPKILPCQHTVCKAPCLEGLIDRFSRTVKCPECRAEHFVPRNGVDSFPTNITISGFLDLQATASEGSRSHNNREDAGGAASGGSPRKCGVCENEAETVKCFHCDKMVCSTCKQSHSAQMRMDVSRLIQQIRRGLPKLSTRMSEVEHKGAGVKQTAEAVRAQVRGTIDRFISYLRERELSLLSEVDTFQQGELRSLRLHSENLEVELASISSYCDSMEGFLNSTEANVPDADLVNVRHQCSQYMQQLRQAEMEEIPQLRSLRFDFSGDSLQAGIATLGTLTVSNPSDHGRTSRNEAGAENSHNPRARARWSDSNPRVPMMSAAAVAERAAPHSHAIARGSQHRSPSPPAHYRPTPPYRTDSALTPRAPRSDSSWMEPSHSLADPPRSIYLPSRHEDYMFAMSTNTDDIREVLEEMRLQEEWEMNNTIRESARSRNTRQNISLFGPQSHGRGRGQRPAERMAGLMGGGGGPNRSPSPDQMATARVTPRAAGAPSRVVEGSRGRLAADSSHADSLRALEEEIHDLQVSDSSGATPQAATTSQANTRTLQPRRVPNASGDDRPLMGGGVSNDAGDSSGSQGRGDRGAAQAGQRARGRGSLRTVPSRASRSQSNGNAQQTANANANNNRPRGHHNAGNAERRGSNQSQSSASSQAASHAPTAAARSRTFVQQEPLVSETADLPNVTNNGMSFSINFDDVTPAQGAVRSGNHNNQTPRPSNTGPRPDDSLRVSQSFNKYKRKNQPVKILGSRRGSGEGVFTWPRGVAVSSLSDGLVVADSSNHRAQMFDAGGAFVKSFGSYGQNDGEFDCLAGVAVSPMGEIVICDRYNHRVQVFDRYGQFIRAFGSEGSGDGQLSYPWGVACDSAGFIYVCDKENHRIQVFQSNGTFVRKFGTLGNRPGQLENPNYIALTPENKILVSDSSNHRIQMFNTSGTYIKSFGSQGNGQGQMKYPKGLAVDAQGFIIVADSGNSRVQVYRGNGDYFCQFGNPGTGSGQFRGLEGLAVTKDGKVVVCDKDNHRVQIF